MLKRNLLIFILFSGILTNGCFKKQSFKTDTIIILPRTSWNANEPIDFPKHTPVRITIHHEGTYFPQDSVAFRHIKNIQIWGMREKKWADVPYHFFIDGFGNIIEGREILTVGETNTSYDPTGHILISIIGEYHHRQKINQKQMKSLINLIAYLCNEFNINPDSIRGHRDYCKIGETNCPGDNVYQYLENNYIKKEVKRRLKI